MYPYCDRPRLSFAAAAVPVPVNLSPLMSARGSRKAQRQASHNRSLVMLNQPGGREADAQARERREVVVTPVKKHNAESLIPRFCSFARVLQPIRELRGVSFFFFLT